jgi:hypothetical protein
MRHELDQRIIGEDTFRLVWDADAGVVWLVLERQHRTVAELIVPGGRAADAISHPYLYLTVEATTPRRAARPTASSSAGVD